VENQIQSLLSATREALGDMWTVASAMATESRNEPILEWAPPPAIDFGAQMGQGALLAATPLSATIIYTPPAGTVLSAGVQQIRAELEGLDSMETGSAQHQITVNRVNPNIAWAAPAPIDYGTALDGTQLNAARTGDGVVTYNPAAGTVLNAGVRDLVVDVAQGTNHTAAQHTVQVTVDRADPAIVWGAPASIVYGVALDGIQLNAARTGDGVVTYNPAAGTVLNAGVHDLVVDVAQGTNHVAAQHTVQATVDRADPAIVWAGPAAIVVGTALDGTQLNAARTGDGVVTYNPAAGFVLGVGVHDLVVDVAQGTDHAAAQRTVQVTVTLPDPNIIWAAPASIVYGTALDGTQLNAARTGDGVITYNPAAGTVLNAGVRDLVVSVAQGTNHAAAQHTVQITVNRANPAIVWAAPQAIVAGNALGFGQLNATRTGDGFISYNPSNGVVLNAGTHNLVVNVAQGTNHAAAKHTVQITVNTITSRMAQNMQDSLARMFGGARADYQIDRTSGAPFSDKNKQNTVGHHSVRVRNTRHDQDEVHDFHQDGAYHSRQIS
jgi:preprotein translocase subunit YajC